MSELRIVKVSTPNWPKDVIDLDFPDTVRALRCADRLDQEDMDSSVCFATEFIEVVSKMLMEMDETENEQVRAIMDKYGVRL